MLYRVTQKKGESITLQSPVTRSIFFIFERFKTQNDRADSAVLLVFEAFKGINF